MHTKKPLLVFLMLPIVFLLCWTLYLEYELKSEKTVIVRMTGFDPKDLLSGHYLHLQPVWTETDCSQFTNDECPTELFAVTYRYYLPEFDAKYLDKRLLSENLKIDMLFVLRGQAKPMVKDLLIDNKPWKEWIKQSVE